jgi:hypothetical protein
MEGRRTTVVYGQEHATGRTFPALLLTFRHFWANDEPSNFRRLLNIVARHAPEARALVDGLRTKWNQALFGGIMFISFNDENLTANTLFDLWLNAHYFHNDQAKQQALDRLYRYDVSRLREVLTRQRSYRVLQSDSPSESCAPRP